MSLNELIADRPKPWLPIRVWNCVCDNAFQLISGASAGRIMVSDAKGNGTWQSASGAGLVESVEATDPSIDVDNTDPSNPTISATGVFPSGVFTTSLQLNGTTPSITWLKGGTGNFILWNMLANPTASISMVIDDVKTAGLMVGSTRGAITQSPSITSSVTLNGSSGIITTVSSTLGTDTSASFALVNSYYTSSDQVIQLTTQYAGNGFPVCFVNFTNPGTNTITISINNAAGVALTAVILIHFNIT